jgi:hypothetical protein
MDSWPYVLQVNVTLSAFRLVNGTDGRHGLAVVIQ